MRTVCATITFLLIVQAAFAGEFNPFIGVKSKEAPKARKASSTKTAASSLPQLPMAPSLPPMSSPPPPAMNGAQGAQAKADSTPPGASLRVMGRIGDQVTLADATFGERSIVKDGTMKGGCLVLYPDVLCGKSEIEEAQKKIPAVPARTAAVMKTAQAKE